MADSSRSSSSKRVQDFLPSFQPSYVSLISLFLCGILWLKNEATNERLSMLETTSPREISLRSGFPNWYFSEKSFRSTEEPRGSSFERTFAQDGSKRFHYSSAIVSADVLTKSRVRNRRQASNESSQKIAIDEVRQEIIKQFERLVPHKFCKASEKVCPSGPPGPPGLTGSKGTRGRRGPQGTRGRRGAQGVMGPPGKAGKSGMTGPSGPKGEKGDRGLAGQKGVPGPRGRPGQTISSPKVVLSPTEETGDEGGNATFYCTVSGNPGPTVEWLFNERKLVSGIKHSIEEGKLTIKYLNYSDAGKYNCVATNILGSSSGSVTLTVRGVPVFTKVPSSLATPYEGSDFQETCQATGYPMPKLSWLRLGVPLPAGRTEVKGGNLTITKVRLSDGGSYECAASNGMGTKKARISLAVQRIPAGMKDPECNTYIVNEETDRSVMLVNNGPSHPKCDNTLAAGWYRFNSTAGSKMPTTCIGKNRCNTRASGWLNGAHPSPQEGIVNRIVCFNWVSNCCNWQTSIRVRNCGLFYVYYLTKPTVCHLRYCVTN